MELVERQVFDWSELTEQQRAEIRFAVKAEAAQQLRRLPKMIAAKVMVEIIAESLGETSSRMAMSAVGTLASDLAVQTLAALERSGRRG